MAMIPLRVKQEYDQYDQVFMRGLGVGVGLGAILGALLIAFVCIMGR